MKKSLLEIVQEIMNDTSSDIVNSIDDTVESVQVAQIVQSTYLAMMSTRNWEHLRRSVALTPYSDATYPTHMKVVEDIKELLSVNYNRAKVGDTRKRYEPIKYQEPDVFLYRINQEDNTSPLVDTVVDISGIELFIRNDQAPSFFTSIDGQTLIFNSYDKSVDSTLQESKFQAMAYVMPTWRHIDTFVPDLPAEAFSGLIEEAKSKAFSFLKQEDNSKVEQEARRQNQWLSRRNWQVAGGIKTPDYGRKTRK